MHEYILGHADRKSTYYIAAILSGLVSSAIGFLISKLELTTGVLLAAPSGLAIFLLLFLAFDRYLWRVPLLYHLGIIKIPYLSGEWDAIITTVATGKPIPAKLTIHQSYTKMRVCLETEKSRSFSQMAVLEMIDPTSFRLRYEYLSTFEKDLATTLRHHGVSEFVVRSASHRFDGRYKARYYTEMTRDTHGEITITRSQA